MNRPLKTLTVRELIARLEDEDPDARVVFTADYGDYHHTQQALGIDGKIEELLIEPCPGYSNSGWAVSRDDSDVNGLEYEARRVLVLR